MRYEQTPAGALQRSLGLDASRLRGRTESEQRALRQQWEAAMDASDASMPGVSPWRARLEQAREFAEEIRSRGNWISSVGDCPQCATEERSGLVVDRLDHEHVVNDLKLQERLRSQARIHEAERSGAIRAVRNADIDRVNRERLEAAQRRQDRLNGPAA